MSKITNDGLTRYGTGCLIDVPIWRQLGVKGSTSALVLIVAVSEMSSASVSDQQRSASDCDRLGYPLPTIVVTSPRRQQTDDDHVTNMAADDTARSRSDVRVPRGVGGEVIRTCDERGSVLVKTANSNGVWSGGTGARLNWTTTTTKLRPGELHRRLNAIVRDRIIFFTKKDRSPSAPRR